MQSKYKTRTLFLKLFTQELIINTNPKAILPQTTQEEPEILSIINQPKTLQPTPIIKPLTRPLKPRLIRRIRLPIQPTKIFSPQIQPDLNKPLPQGFELGKIDNLLKDPSINMIECAGPGKFILVRALGKVKSTKVSLNEQEIKSVIEKFSQEARIPVMTGIFKAAVGNLLITAIVSEFVGSRFIISKRIG